MASFKKVEDEKLVIQWRVPEWYPTLKSDELEKLKLFHGELIKFTRTINLISVASMGNADLVHFADSIAASQALLEKCTKMHIYDIGSGNGLPALVLAIFAPDRKITCVERDARKVEFIKHMASQLKLKNVDIMPVALESLPENSIECGISRGFASIPKALLAGRKVFASKGEYYHMKGDIWSRELADIPTQLCSFWSPSLFAQYSLPDKTAEKRYLVLTQKT